MFAHTAVKSIRGSQCKQSESIMQIHCRMKRKSPLEIVLNAKNDQCTLCTYIFLCKKMKNFCILIIITVNNIDKIAHTKLSKKERV